MNISGKQLLLFFLQNRIRTIFFRIGRMQDARFTQTKII